MYPDCQRLPFEPPSGHRTGQAGVEAEIDFAQLAALVIGVKHLLAASQDERVGVQADGDAVTGDLSQRGDVSLESGEEGLFVGGEAVFCDLLRLDTARQQWQQDERQD
jgi:hypothetical protein